MKKFRIPRKIKKKLTNGIYVYVNSNCGRKYLLAYPAINQEDYEAYKDGVLKNMLKK
jgi:hypothetical protein